jgi:hypothetical protein
MQGFRKRLALTSRIGLLALVVWAPTAAAADYAVNVSRDASNRYVGNYSWNGVIKTTSCYENAFYDQAVLRLTTPSTGTLFFSSGRQCPVLNVFDPAANQPAGTYYVSVNSQGDGYYELTDGSALITTYGYTYGTNVPAMLTLPSPVFDGAVYGGTLKFGSLYPETVTHLYLQRQGSVVAPTAPNLTITAFAATPTAVNVGGTSALTATVRNLGDASSAATTLRYYYWTGSVWSEIATCASSVASLSSGSTATKSCNITMPSAAGEYLFGVHVDAVPGESNTADNDSPQVKVTVGAAPPHAFTTMPDFNGDGKSDIVFENDIGTRWLFNMNGVALQTATALPNAAPGWVLSGMGDFDGNGTADMLWQNSADPTQYWVYLMNGPTIIGGGLLTVAPGFKPIYIADFNSDLKADILWENNSGARWFYFMNGAAVVSYAAVPTAAAGWEIAGVGDFNGDHRADLLWVNTANPTQYWIYLMNGAAVMGSGGVNVAPGYQPTWIGDMNRDGKADIIWENGTSSRWVYTMNGAALGTGFSLPQAAAGWDIVGVGDFDNAGGLDLLWQNTANPTQYWTYLLSTTGTLVGSGGLSVAPGYEPLAY